jgi:hypothetical protein
MSSSFRRAFVKAFGCSKTENFSRSVGTVWYPPKGAFAVEISNPPVPRVTPPFILSNSNYFFE